MPVHKGTDILSTFSTLPPPYCSHFAFYPPRCPALLAAHRHRVLFQPPRRVQPQSAAHASRPRLPPAAEVVAVRPEHALHELRVPDARPRYEVPHPAPQQLLHQNGIYRELYLQQSEGTE